MVAQALRITDIDEPKWFLCCPDFQRHLAGFPLDPFERQLSPADVVEKTAQNVPVDVGRLLARGHLLRKVGKGSGKDVVPFTVEESRVLPLLGEQFTDAPLCCGRIGQECGDKLDNQRHVRRQQFSHPWCPSLS